MIEEETLIEKCLKNDRMAQKALYEKYKTRMYTLTYRITNDKHLAEDALQEGFVNVFKGLPSFKGKSQLGTWIHTVIARAAISTLKLTPDYMFQDNIVHPSCYENTALDADYLEKAILGLPDGYRTIFTLFEIEGFNHKEIAKLLGISENTSKSQLHKAKRMLRKRLGYEE